LCGDRGLHGRVKAARAIWLPVFLWAGAVFAGAAPSAADQIEAARQDGRAHSQIEILRRMLDEAPGDPALNEQLLALWLDVADFRMAENLLDGWPDAPVELAALARARILDAGKGKPSEAAEVLRGYLKENPSSRKAAEDLAGLLWREGAYETLVEFLSSSSLVDGDASLLLWRAEARRAAGDGAGALRDFAAARARFPDDGGMQRKAPSFERFEAALPGLDAAGAAIAKNPGDPGALAARAFWLREAGMPSGIVRAGAEAALRAEPRSVAARLLMASATGGPREKWRVDPAEAWDAASFMKLVALDRAVAGGADLPGALVARGGFLSYQRRQFLAGLDDAVAALDALPDHRGALVLKVHSLARLGKLRDAAASLAQLESLDPAPLEISTARASLAEARFATGDLPSALDAASGAIAAAPTARALKLRAAIFERLGQPDAAAADRTAASALESKR
jgi:tetratricopeptide (TPR) repeat protein